VDRVRLATRDTRVRFGTCPDFGPQSGVQHRDDVQIEARNQSEQEQSFGP
jgi:hypothetical protein